MRVLCLLLVFVLVRVPPCVWADVGYFFQLTDVHFDPWALAGGDTEEWCHVFTGERKSGWAGDYGCYTSFAVLESALQFVVNNSLHPPVDFVAWTGDQSPLNRKYPFPSEDLHLSQKLIYEVAQNVTSLLQRTLGSSLPVYPVLGNHAVWKPSWLPSTKDEHTVELLKTYGTMWRSYLGQEQFESFLETGSYEVVTEQGVRILSINTLWCDKFNIYSWDGSVDADINRLFEIVETCFSKARELNESVFLMGHIPMSREQVDPGCYYRFRTLLEKYADVVRLQIYGHTHTDSWITVSDSTAQDLVGVMFVSPSLTPFSYHGHGHNPALRLFKYDRTDFSVLNYIQFFANLSEANARGKIQWEVEYDAMRDYELKSMEPLEWFALSKRMKTNVEWFWRVYQHHRTMVDEACDSKCRKEFVCSLQSLSEEEYVDCLI